MAANRKFFVAFAVPFLLLFALSQNSLAKVYEWTDCTQPFINDFKVGGKTAVKVELPESVLKKFEKIELIIEHDGMGKTVIYF
jgi:hypothetical protein